MSWAEILLVWRKETLDTLRDRRTILAMVVLPLLIYPLLIIVISQLGLQQVEKLRQSRARVAFVPADAAPELAQALAADTTFVLLQPAQPDSALKARDIDVIVELPADFESRIARQDSAEAVVRVDLSRDRGTEMRDRMENFLFDWRDRVVTRRLAERSLPETFTRPFDVRVDNAADARQMGGSFVGRFLPVILVIMMMTGAFYPAIDVTAGERERGTLETLLVTPAGRFNLVLGKFLTVFIASLVTTLANLVSIAFTIFFLIGSAKLGGSAAQGLVSLVDWRAILLIFAIMIPMALFFSALSVLVASFARSFKEAQNYLSPLVLACVAPAYVTMLPGIELSPTLALVPVANVVLLSREFLLGNVPGPFLVVTMAVMTGLALLLLHRAVSLFGAETMLEDGGGAMRFSWRSLLPRAERTREGVLTPSVVAPVFLLVLLGFFYVGTPLQMHGVKLGLAVTQLAVIAGIPLISLRMLGIPIVRTLRLGRPRPAALPLLALLAAPVATGLAALAAILQGVVVQIPESYREIMHRLVTTESGGGLALAILVFAVLPALCEETLFRGYVLRGLLQRVSPAKAVLWSALLFGAFHFDLYRLLPTAVLGLVLGWVALVTGSLWPSIVLHAANNAIAVLATNTAVVGRIPWLAEDAVPPLGILIGALAVGVVALVAMARLGRGRGV